MKISEIIERHGKSVSFEFFPPKSAEGEEQLFATVNKLEAFEPAFVSVTYGAGGSTQDNTRKIVERIAVETPLTVMPHLTCVNQSERELRKILADYQRMGIENILALRGDPPIGTPLLQNTGLCYGRDLVKLAREFDFSVGVAVYPEGHAESPNLAMDMIYTKEKIDAGADFAITQMFFDNRYFYDFMERAERIGIHIPVIAGIMPITDLGKIKKFSQSCHANLPPPLVGTMEDASAGDVRKLGIEFAVKQAEDLLHNGFRYLHFYSLNRSDVVTEVLCNLSLTKGSRVCMVG